MKKALALLLTAFLLVSLFISCAEPKVEITISFDGNHDDVKGEMADLKAYKGEDVELPKHVFEREGYYFTGWSTASDGSGDWYYDTDTVRFEEDTTLYAQWYNDVELVIFDPNGAPGMEYLQWVKENEETALRPNKYTKKGYFFTGWNTKRDGSGNHYDDKANITANDKVILYAQWTIVDLATMFDNMRWDQRIGKEFSLSKDVTITGRVVVTGDVTLILPEGMTLTASSGITVKEGNKLTIKGSGKLNATGLTYQAGIGGDDSEDACGDITIEGGIINATGGDDGAGIGSGDFGAYGGTVTINGGTVNATGGQAAAGIGGGRGCDGGTITINGGTVIAKGGPFGTGIGGGNGSAGGNIKITDGTVTAEGGDNAAGIGGSYIGKDGGNITITGGTVTAKGGFAGAGIGGGDGCPGGNVIISGGTVTAASGGSAVGIGMGNSGDSCGKLTIGYGELQESDLAINSGWYLYYGNSQNPTDNVTNYSGEWAGFTGEYMNVTTTAPSAY